MNLSIKKLFQIIVIGFISILLTPKLSSAQSKAEELDQLITQYYDYGLFNGSVLIADEAKVILKKGYGMANMEWGIPNTPSTRHRLGSITKQFTAMLILQLAAEDKIDLNAPVSKYLPYYSKTTGDKITTHHLLTHTAGIPNYTSFPGFMKDESRDPYSPKEFIKKFEDKELDFEPGSQFSYSNSGYFLLGVIIEELSGKTYEQMLREKIFEPLNMKNSGYDNHDEILKNRASGYEKMGSSYANAKYLDTTIPYAAGSLYSTVEDLYLWDQALYGNKLLSKKYMKLYFEPQTPAYNNISYAYGWMVGKSQIGMSTDSVETIAHGGGINGFNTYISRAPSNKSLVVLLNNTGGAPLQEMSTAIRGILNDKPFAKPKRSLAFELPAVIKAKGVDSAIEHFNKKKEKDDYKVVEGEINAVGYELMMNKEYEAAAKIFALNISEFPKSSNVYDSYGEALMNLGRNEEAIKNYKKSLEINPANKNAIDMLKKLGVDTDSLEEEVTVDEEILTTYIGKYALSPSFIITVSKEGTQMKAQATGQPVFDIFPKSDSEFYLKVVPAQIKFNKDDSGKVVSLTLYQNGREMEGKRM